MRTLVTGGAGYVGSVITEVLLERGHEVTVLDSLIKGHREAVRPGAKLVIGDLADRALLIETMKKSRIEAVMHMAAHSMVGESVTAPLKYFDNNVCVSLGLLQAMQECGVDALVFSSSAAVYGEPQRQPIAETDKTEPTSPYGETKLAFERALRWCGEAYGLRSVSLRYFNAAGASRWCGERHEPESHLIPLLLQVAAGQRPSVTIYGDDYPTPDGTCVRDYVHVLDLAKAHILALETFGRPGPRCAIFNVGGGSKGTSVKEVVDATERVTGRKLTLELGPRRPGDPAVLVASSDRIKAELGFAAEHPQLERIIDSAWRWMTTAAERR